MNIPTQMNNELDVDLNIKTQEPTEHFMRKPLLWPWIAFLVATFLYDASLSLIVTQLAESNISINFAYWVIGLICSLVCGQWFLVMVIGGLWGRTWISGYAWAAMLMLTVVIATNLGCLVHLALTNRSDDYIYTPMLFALAALINGIVISSVAIVVFRVFRGWRLTREEGVAQHAAFGITDLIIGTALVALLIIIGNDVMSLGVTTTQTFWEPVVMLGASACVIGLTAVMPIVWIVFRTTRWGRLKLLTVIAINCAIFGFISGGIIQYSESGGAEPYLTNVVRCAAGGLGAFCYFVVGLLMLRLAGFRLQTGKQVASLTPVSESRVRKFAVPAGLFASLLLAHNGQRAR